MIMLNRAQFLKLLIMIVIPTFNGFTSFWIEEQLEVNLVRDITNID